MEQEVASSLEKWVGKREGKRRERIVVTRFENTAKTCIVRPSDQTSPERDGRRELYGIANKVYPGQPARSNFKRQKQHVSRKQCHTGNARATGYPEGEPRKSTGVRDAGAGQQVSSDQERESEIGLREKAAYAVVPKWRSEGEDACCQYRRAPAVTKF